jgi:signal recognition particle GTPase
METKYCKKCGEFKPISEFYESQNSLLCKYHHKEDAKKRKKEYRLNPKVKEKEKLKYQERKLRMWENYLLSNSKNRECENTLTVEDIKEIYNKQNGLCYWFKVPLIPSLIKKHPQQPSLDRLDNSKGYVKDNVVLSCYAANIGRNETNPDIWLDFLDVMFNKTNKTKDKINKSIQSLREKLKSIKDKEEFVIYDENLNQTVVTNLNQYCLENEISINTIHSSRKKIKRKTQKGLIVLNRSKNESVEKRIYILSSPDGIIHKLTSLRSFCLENGLSDSALQRVGKGELKHHKGWTCKYETIILK